MIIDNKLQVKINPLIKRFFKMSLEDKTNCIYNKLQKEDIRKEELKILLMFLISFGQHIEKYNTNKISFEIDFNI